MKYVKPLLLFLAAMLCAFAAFLCFGVAVRVMLISAEHGAVWLLLLVPCGLLISVLTYEIIWIDQRIGECIEPWRKDSFISTMQRPHR